MLYGPEDHVIWPDFPARAEVAFPNRVGPFVVPGAGHSVQSRAPGDAAQAEVARFLA